MNKKTIALAIAILCMIALFSSCTESDNSSNTPTVSEEWKVFQQKVLDDSIATETFATKSSESGNGIVHYKTTTTMQSDKESRITAEGTPHFNDSVRCRYTGWLVLQSGEKYIFDSTERDSDNAKDGRICTLDNGLKLNGFDVTDGLATILQIMVKGEERTICLPYQIGYGTNGSYNQTTGAVTIPGYSTLFYTVKLLEIYPVNPNEFPK